MTWKSLFLGFVLAAGSATNLQAESLNGETPLTTIQATALALKAHAEARAIDTVKNFYLRVRSGNAPVDTMRSREACTLAELQEALDGSVAKPDWLEWEVTLGWTETTALWSTGKRDGARFGEEDRAWRQDCVWTKDRAFERNTTPGSPARVVYTSTPNELWEGRLREFAWLRVAPHRFWWAESQHRYDMLSPVHPEDAEYRFVASEEFDKEVCDVIESSARAQRLWIGRDSGRLRGVLTFSPQNVERFPPFYQHEIVRKITGRSFATDMEYREWAASDAVTPQQQQQLTRAWSELNFEYFKPNELIRFRDYREVSPGIWIPFREDRAFTHSADGNQNRHQYFRLWVTVEEARQDVGLAEIVEKLQPQDGDLVQDQRFGVILNYQFQRKRTQGELLELVERERQKQAADAELVQRMLLPVTGMVGKPAPSLPESGWIGGSPLQVQGRPYLVHFWATWCGPCKSDMPQLRELAAQGIAVVGLHPAGTPVEEIQKVIRQQQLGYPTYLATAEIDGERKIGGYPVTMFPYCILVDRAGQVVEHGSLGPELLARLRALPASE
jgi:thiol-disulfide isomerase/thioredoxin